MTAVTRKMNALRKGGALEIHRIFILGVAVKGQGIRRRER